MTEQTFRGGKVDDSARRIRVLNGFRHGGRSYSAGEFVSLPGHVARQLVRHNRASFAPVPVTPLKKADVKNDGEKEASETAPGTSKAPVVELRPTEGSNWIEIVVDGEVVGKKNGRKAAEKARDELLAGA